MRRLILGAAVTLGAAGCGGTTQTVTATRTVTTARTETVTEPVTKPEDVPPILDGHCRVFDHGSDLSIRYDGPGADVACRAEITDGGKRGVYLSLAARLAYPYPNLKACRFLHEPTGLRVTVYDSGSQDRARGVCALLAGRSGTIEVP